jgi:hypothetical protein
MSLRNHSGKVLHTLGSPLNPDGAYSVGKDAHRCLYLVQLAFTVHTTLHVAEVLALPVVVSELVEHRVIHVCVAITNATNTCGPVNTPNTNVGKPWLQRIDSGD